MVRGKERRGGQAHLDVILDIGLVAAGQDKLIEAGQQWARYAFTTTFDLVYRAI